jgi:hypothetical protein
VEHAGRRLLARGRGTRLRRGGSRRLGPIGREQIGVWGASMMDPTAQAFLLQGVCCRHLLGLRGGCSFLFALVGAPSDGPCRASFQSAQVGGEVGGGDPLPENRRRRGIFASGTGLIPTISATLTAHSVLIVLAACAFRAPPRAARSRSSRESPRPPAARRVRPRVPARLPPPGSRPHPSRRRTRNGRVTPQLC